MGVIPVVTRFLCPPDTPLCISSPTNVSAQTSSPNICNTTFDSVAEDLELITRRVCPELFPRCSDQEAYLQHIICDKASLFTTNRRCLKTERKANLITMGFGIDCRQFELFHHEKKLYNIEYLHKSINISIWFYASSLFPSR